MCRELLGKRRNLLVALGVALLLTTGCAAPGASDKHGTWTLTGDRWQLVAEGGSNNPETLAGLTGMEPLVTGVSGRPILPLSGWQWNGSAWDSDVAAVPGGDVIYAVADDPLKRTVYVIAQTFLPSPSAPALWSWDGNSWTRLGLPIDQSSSAVDAVGWDDLTQTLVLAAVDEQSNTWRYDGIKWTAMNVATPSGRSMVFDPGSRVLLLFPNQGDASSWDGMKWSPVAGSAIPGGVDLFDDATIALNRSDSSVEAFSDSGGRVTTWRWEGARWVHFQTQGGPPPEGQLSAAYDAVAGNIVLIDVVGPRQVAPPPGQS